MKIYVQIMDDDGLVVGEHRADASVASSWNPPTGQRFLSKMPPQSDAQNTGTYELFRITFQPHVRVDRPNGYTAQVPGPTTAPANPMGYKPTFVPPWGQTTQANPSQAPQGPQSNLNRGTPTGPVRG